MDLVWPSLGDFFKFEHDAYTNGLNVLSIFTFQTMLRAMELVELYLVCLNLIGSPTTTKKKKTHYFVCTHNLMQLLNTFNNHMYMVETSS
jgi:hypothetical protein